jgi:hypothetical protein
MVSYEKAQVRSPRVSDLGLRTAVGAPIIVKGGLWGAGIVGSTHPGETLPHDTEARVGEFTDLVCLRGFTGDFPGVFIQECCRRWGWVRP